ncbi:hypothetical protein E2C01_039264 [Portunus trituberculatus]|uniref:Uncharacterized protein n=1 Tax=Portunus trituberculatus TaxID=210409 RepID=A0A5B7FEB4_PORTR|nr:hypothetical protein [Portunus trituberculatus]
MAGRSLKLTLSRTPPFKVARPRRGLPRGDLTLQGIRRWGRHPDTGSLATQH